ncbi:MAG: 2Fe-2S iron-sulfur cluster binding domain-containing protein [Clostridia bacterium]|nr:2Fe-2S iron-sulfur cluster binding domain-containing protein [Clostridia bacterium]
MEIELTVNDIQFKTLVEPDEMLLDTLRRLGFKSVKRGCDTTSCGICSVIVDGKLVPSCSYYSVRAAGKSVLTVEGIQEEARRIGAYLTAEGAEQCGFCSPGLVMAVYAMKNELRNPTLADIKHYLAGNMCRCSGYEGQHRGILKYLEVCGNASQ